MKNFFITISVFIFLLFTISAEAAIPSYLKQFQNIKQNEPSFSEILRIFYENEKLTYQEWSMWQKRLKKSAYFPKVYLGFDHQLKESQSLSVTDNISISGGNVTIGPDDNDLDFDNDLGQTFRVRLVWDLEQTVFNKNFFQLARGRYSLANMRFNLSEKIFKVYQARYGFLAEHLRLKTQSRNKSLLYYTKFLLLTDRLNELTNHLFEERLWKGYK